MKELPQCIDFERYLLGGCLQYRQALEELRSVLDPADFILDKHRHIWNYICELYDAGEPVDCLTVARLIVKRGEMRTVAQASELTELTEGVPEISLLRWFKPVREARKRREFIVNAEHLALLAEDPGYSVDDLYATAAKSLSEIGNDPRRGAISTAEMVRAEGLEKLLRPRQHGAIRLPFPKLDAALSGLSKGQLVAIMAATSRGKTSIALQIAVAAAIQGFPPVIWTMEMSRASLYLRMVTQMAGVWAASLMLTREERAAVQEAAGKLEECPVYMNSDARNVGQFVSDLRRVRTQHGLGLAIVDYLQQIRVMGGTRHNRAQEVSENSRALKMAAMDLEIPIVVLSQVDRSSVKGDGEIGLHSAKESGDIENDADVVMWIDSKTPFARDADTLCSLHIGKQREGGAGFSIPMAFRPQSQSFVEMES